MTHTDELRTALTGVTHPDWLATALRRVAADPEAIFEVFPAVGRQCGRAELPDLPDWRTDDAARVLTLRTLPTRGAALAYLVDDLYRHGDAHEKRAVLKGLPTLDLDAASKRTLLYDAIRTNDARLLAAALGPAAAVLDAPMWRQAVLKCVFTGVPLHQIADLDDRADAELAVMLDGLARERRAAGRTVPDDAMDLLRRLTTEGSLTTAQDA